METAFALSLLDALLPVPPFPGARPQLVFRPARIEREPDLAQARALIAAMRAARLGGSSWGARPAMPGTGLRVLRLGRGASAPAGDADFIWRDRPVLDPWPVLEAASVLRVAGDEASAVLAAIAGVSVEPVGPSVTAHLAALAPGTRAHDDALASLIAQLLAQADCHDPMIGDALDPLEYAGMAARWRALIDDNRALVAAFGFARWKRHTAAPMLWGGHEGGVPFLRAGRGVIAALPDRAAVAVWKARIASRSLAALEGAPLSIHEVEDGFIRSVGLGANCVPPLSLIVDDLGVHYDPSRPSRHEAMLAAGSLDEALLARARALRARIVASGISKYGVGGQSMERRGGDRRHLLVVGQVEDDRSVRFGCRSGVRTNAALLAAVRAAHPEAWIVYRPHPDIEAGHRPGRIAPALLAELADEVAADAPISALIAMADEIHVMTSLAGFEALIHGKAVTTWGSPFYAGWGLTTDLAPGWSHRRGIRTLDELIAVTLLVYPRYVDPVSGLPCEAERLVDRLVSGMLPAEGWLVRLRTWQGRARRALAGVVDRLS